MATRMKHYLLIALALGAFYFLLSHHIIFSNFPEFDLLKKEKLTMEYTFFSLSQADLYDALSIDMLRDAGIENIMLDRGMVSEKKLDEILLKIDRKKEVPK